MSWISYWNGAPSIYVCARHKEAHDFDIAFSIVRHLPRERARVLDFGCGEATRAKYVSSRCESLFLWDAAESVRDRLTRRYASDRRISVLSEDLLAQLPRASLDLVVMSSVVQYIPLRELSERLTHVHTLLSPSGRLIIADVIPKNVSVLQDALELLKFARQERFLRHALLGLTRTALSDYGSTRARLRLSKFDGTEFIDLLRAHGYTAARLDRNFGHNQRRMAFEASPISKSQSARQGENPVLSSTLEPAA